MRTVISITKLHNGYLHLSCVHKGRYVKKLYMGYSRKAAKADFLAQLEKD